MSEDLAMYNSSSTADIVPIWQTENLRSVEGIGTSLINIIPCFTSVILEKKWETKYLEFVGSIPYSGTDIEKLTVPSGFMLTKFRVIGVGDQAKKQAPIREGMLVDLRDNFRLKRIMLEDNPFAWDVYKERIKKEEESFLRDALKAPENKNIPASEIKNPYRNRIYTITEYLLADVYNIAFIYDEETTG